MVEGEKWHSMCCAGGAQGGQRGGDMPPQSTRGAQSLLLLCSLPSSTLSPWVTHPMCQGRMHSLWWHLWCTTGWGPRWAGGGAMVHVAQELVQVELKVIPTKPASFHLDVPPVGALWLVCTLAMGHGGGGTHQAMQAKGPPVHPSCTWQPTCATSCLASHPHPPCGHQVLVRMV